MTTERTHEAAGFPEARLTFLLESIEAGGRDEGGGRELEEGVLSLGGEHIGRSGELILGSPRYVTAAFFRRMRRGVLRGNEVLLVKDGATIGKLSRSRLLGGRLATVNEHVYLLRPRIGVDADFLYFALASDFGQDQIRLESRGAAQAGLPQEFVSKTMLPVPGFETQVRIAAFLDRKTAAVDALIAKKERQIELLQEKRQALITQAVTKGLDPNAPTKDSGIEWLGEIPAHWPVVRVSYIAKVQNGMTPSRDRIDYWEDGTIPWISSSQVNDYVVTTAREFITDRAIRETRIRMVPAGSVLVGLVGQGKTRGLSARMGIAGCINQNVAAITPDASMDGKFLHLVLRHAYPSIRELGRGGQQDAMNCDIIRSLRVPMPPLAEQLRLIDYVDGQHARLDAVIERVETHADLLREYRQALISAAVTGKIDIPAEEAA
jgi:type I restriction enzyme S subunit